MTHLSDLFPAMSSHSFKGEFPQYFLIVLHLRCRQRERDEPHRRYRHGHRRSRSHDSSNWPAEGDYRLVDMPHQQRLSGEVYPGRVTHSRSDDREGRHESSNGMTRQNSLTAQVSLNLKPLLLLSIILALITL